jgi:hypothetical protein
MISGTTESERKESGQDSGRERYRVAGDKVIGKIKDLIHEGNIRRIIIKNEDGRTLIEVPLTVGAVAAVLVPVWAAIGAVAALVANCSIEVEREEAAG